MKQIFICYSRKDGKIKQRLKRDLLEELNKNLIKGEYNIWDDQHIPTGDGWYNKILKELKSSEAAILLISKNFLSSKFINFTELPLLIKQNQDEKLKLIPIVIEKCSWKKNEQLKKIQCDQLSDMHKGAILRFYYGLYKCIKGEITTYEYRYLVEKVCEALLVDMISPAAPNDLNCTESPVRIENKHEKNPHWHLTIDRLNQYLIVKHYTEEMLQKRTPKSFIFLWYGEEGQGVEIFSKRLLVELRDKYHDICFIQKNIAWPTHKEKITTSLAFKLTEAFCVSGLDAIPMSINKECQCQGKSDKQTLIYISHEPVISQKIITYEVIQQYFEWWAKEFVPKLQHNQFVLLGLSFIVDNPPLFNKKIKDAGLQNFLTKNTTRYKLLEKMKKLEWDDLDDFLRNHDIQIPSEIKEEYLDRLLKKTDGKYELTVEELKTFFKEQFYD